MFFTKERFMFLKNLANKEGKVTQLISINNLFLKKFINTYKQICNSISVIYSL